MGRPRKPIDRFILDSTLRTGVLRFVLSQKEPVTQEQISNNVPGHIYPAVRDLVLVKILAETTRPDHSQRKYFSFIENDVNRVIATQIMKEELV